MAIKIHMCEPLEQYTNGNTAVEVAGITVQAALTDLCAKYPAVPACVFKDGKVSRIINVYLNEEDVRYLKGLATPVKDGDEIAILNALSGDWNEIVKHTWD